MSTIDRQRIVCKEKEELDEFICTICQDILDQPLVTQCCQQSFCKVCINEWLNNNKSCPNDRKDLTINQLVSPPRILINLLNKLRIKCEYYEKGCDVILTIDEMRQHLSNCPKNDKRRITFKYGLDDLSAQWIFEQIVVYVNSDNNLTKLCEAIHKKIKTNKLFDNYMFAITVNKKEISYDLYSSHNLCLDIEIGSFFIRVMGFQIHLNEEQTIMSARKIDDCKITYRFGFSHTSTEFIIKQVKSCVRSQNNYFELSKAICKKIKSDKFLNIYQFVVIVITANKENKHGTYSILDVQLDLEYDSIFIRICGNKRTLTQREIIMYTKENLNYTLIKNIGFNETTKRWLIGQAKDSVKSQDTLYGISGTIFKKIQCNKSLNKYLFIVLTNTNGNEDNGYTDGSLQLKFKLGELLLNIIGTNK